MTTEQQNAFNFLRRGNSTTTQKVVVEKPVIKEIIREVEVEKDCPPCPECPNIPIHIDTLHIKSDEEVSIKNGNVVVKNKNNVSVNKNWIVGNDCKINTPQEKVAGKFAVTSLFNLQPSHIPPYFSPNPKYPKGCNERNYQVDKQEQGKVIMNANNFDCEYLLTDDNTAENGAIIVDVNGIVLGGNGRTMTLLKVISEFPEKYNSYYDLLLEKANNFGIERAKIKTINYPVLVRVINVDDKKSCNYYSRIFNESMKQKMDSLAMAISYIKSLGKEKIQKLARDISEYLDEADNQNKTISLRQIISYKKILPNFIQMMEDAKIINNMNRTTFIEEDGYLSAEADLIIQYMFYAMVFDNKRIINFVINSDYINIEKIFGLLLYIKVLEKPFNILPQFASAIEKYEAGKKSSQLKIDADDIYGQQNMYDEYKIKYIEYLCMLLLEMKNDKQQKAILKNYLNLVKSLTAGFFTPDDKTEITPEHLLQLAFDEEKVLIKLSNLGDKKQKKRSRKSNTKLADKPQTLGDRIANWFRNDFSKKYAWE